MILKFLLIVSIVMQVVSEIIAIRMISRTKFNSAWILFAIAQIILIVQLINQMIYVFQEKQIAVRDMAVWESLILSLCVSIGLFFIPKILNSIDRINQQRQLTEKRLLNTVMLTEERERQRFSKDLHDGLGPLLSSAKMSISSLALLDKDPTHRSIIDNAAYVIDEAIKGAKEISNNLSPHVLVNFGIDRALNNFINRLTIPEGLKIEYRSTLKKERFDSNIETILYRVAGEAINNAIRHAKAERIEVTLTKEGNAVVLSVHDDGIGFNAGKIAPGKGENAKEPPVTGMGLSNILSRVQSVGGEVAINSARNRHTTIRVKIPLNS